MPAPPPPRHCAAAAALLVLAACAAPRWSQGPRSLPCPASGFFHPDSVVMVVVPEDFSAINLSHGHVLRFDAGAVPPGSRYRVRRAAPGHAELDIEPVEGAPAAFRGTARLTLSYGPCGPAGGDLGLYRRQGDSLVPLPSSHDSAGRRVTGTLDGFSVYAIGSN